MELIDIESSRREILEAFWKSPYSNVTYCIDLKIGTRPHHFRKRYIIIRAENTILASEQRKSYIFFCSTIPYTVQKPVRTGFVLNNRNTIDINCVFKRLQPYITVADDVSPLYLLTLFSYPSKRSECTLSPTGWHAFSVQPIATQCW